MSQSPYTESAASFHSPTNPNKETHGSVLSVEEIRDRTKAALSEKAMNTFSWKKTHEQHPTLAENTIRVHMLDYESINQLETLASNKSRTVEVFESLVKPLNLRCIRTHHQYLYRSLVANLPNRAQLLLLLPNQIDPNLGDESAADYLIKELLVRDLAEAVWLRIPQPLSSHSTIGDGFMKILLQLYYFGVHRSEIESIFTPQIDFYKMTSAGADLLLHIHKLGKLGELVDRLPTEINLARVTTYGAEVLRLFKLAGYSDQIIDRLPTECSMDEMTNGAFALLSNFGFSAENSIYPKKKNYPIKVAMQLRDPGQPERTITMILPTVIRLDQLSSESVNEMFQYFNWDDLLDRLPNDITFNLISKPGCQFLDRLLRSTLLRSESKLVIERYLDSLKPALRKPINPEVLKDVDTKVGPYLYEIIESFPILRKSIRRKHPGWISAELSKHGSRSLVYLHIEGDEVKILFRTADFERKGIEAYEQALTLLPEYVTGSWYPELQHSPDNSLPPKRYNGKLGLGYREVFAGASLSEYQQYHLPESIQSSIDRQVAYIRLSLVYQRIAHNHDHLENFNVRFLLSSPDGSEKNLSFDLNAAIQVAVERGWNLTPIVTLRDWDMATIITKR